MHLEIKRNERGTEMSSSISRKINWVKMQFTFFFEIKLYGSNFSVSTTFRFDSSKQSFLVDITKALDCVLSRRFLYV